jgi:hypothetical protein
MVYDVSAHLNPGGQQFRGDDGSANVQVAAALAAYLAGEGSEHAALTALSAARLLVPVIAVPSESPNPLAARDKRSAATPGDKNSEMVLPTLIGRDGRPAVLAFTCLDALTRWRPQARPVPAEADRVWRTAAADGCAVVVDVAGPVPLVVEGARLAALAAGRPLPFPHQDPDVRILVESALAGEPGVAGFSLAAGADGAGGADLAITLRLATADDWRPVASRAAGSLASRLAGRMRRGVEIRVEAARD